MNTPAPIETPVTQQPPTTPLNPESENLKAIFAGMSTESSVLKSVVSGALTDVVADWLIAQFAKTAQAQLNAAENETERWNLLRLAGNDLSRLRRGDHSAGRLALQRAKWEEEIREVTEARWRRENPRECGLPPEAIRMIERELNLL
jgi:hypothetical protein